jgi:hypothetical protein
MSTSISDAKVSRCGAKPVEADSLPCGNDAWVSRRRLAGTDAF